MNCDYPDNPGRHLRAVVGYLSAVLVVSACAPRGVEPAAPKNKSQEHAVERTIVTPHEALSVGELYARAQGSLSAGSFEAAARDFDRIVELDPDGALAPKALFYGAEAHDEAGHVEAAGERYEQYARRFKDAPLARTAWLRSVRVSLHLEQWPAAAAAADTLLNRYAPLRPFESVVAYGAKALERVFADDVERARYFVEKGRNIVEAHAMHRAGRLPRDLAQLYFALGEVRRVKASRIHLRSAPEEFPVLLEQRCQLILDAQRAYSDAMRAYDAHWSAMAGYRVGELYHALHEELMRVPPPQLATGDPRRQALFEGAMRLRYSVLLEKARSMLEHTLAMAERTGENSHWVNRAEQALVELEQASEREQAAIDRLGFSRAELKAALDHLADKHRAAKDRRRPAAEP